jgi:hypothetical protein
LCLFVLFVAIPLVGATFRSAVLLGSIRDTLFSPILPDQAEPTHTQMRCKAHTRSA